MKKVKLQERVTKGTYEKPISKSYYVVVPSGFVEALGWKKGDILYSIVIDHSINGKTVKGVFYFKP